MQRIELVIPDDDRRNIERKRDAMPIFTAPGFRRRALMSRNMPGARLTTSTIKADGRKRQVGHRIVKDRQPIDIAAAGTASVFIITVK